MFLQAKNCAELTNQSNQPALAGSSVLGELKNKLVGKVDGFLCHSVKKVNQCYETFDDPLIEMTTMG